MHTQQADMPSTLAEEFPGWHVWRGRDGDIPKSWYATRGRPLSSMEYREGLYRTLAADDPEDLREQLEQQTAIEAQM